MARFVPRERKHRKLARQKREHVADTNVEVIDPQAPNEKEARRAALSAQLRAEQQGSSTSSKKRKRLDKYVEGKLKKEENAELMRKLAQQNDVDTSLLQSSKKLGRVKETKREKLSRALRERNAGVDLGAGDAVLFEPRREVAHITEAEDEREHAAASLAPQEKIASAYGNGLKQPLEVDETGRPVIRKRKRQKRSHGSSSGAAQHQSNNAAAQENEDNSDGDMASEDAEEWNGFSDNSEDKDMSDGSRSASEDSEPASDSDTESSESESEAEAESKAPRISAFKQWADAQRNAAADFTPSTAPIADAAVKANFKPRAPSPDPLLSSTVSQSAARTSRPDAAITIACSEEVQSARLELPVVQEEQKIMEAIHHNPIVVICGATGSGKTTQIPQMLFENGYGSHVGSSVGGGDKPSFQSKGMIGITQPRRVAATSVAGRVSHELGRDHRNTVGHQVRYDSNVGRNTAIKFMTDGILLREIQQDFPLTKYSCIVLDEAHERSVNTDILIGLLSRIVGLRAEMTAEDPTKYYPLKLIIMSATLRGADFLSNERLFRDGPPPIVEAEGRQYPVTTHFARRTRRDFIDETVEKVAKGHRKLPQGGMLVFLTGQQEIQTVLAKLKARLSGHSTRRNGGDDYEAERTKRNAEEYLEEEADETDDDVDIETEDTEFAIEEDPSAAAASQGRGMLTPQILPLYAALPSAQQAKVFRAAPDGHRQIVLATNVAETSLTIPGIKYVFDCGRSKEQQYSISTGVQTLETTWISKASASQRTGRAGRTGPGHCWRLYSSAVYEQFFAEFKEPEILRTPLESVVLMLKGFTIAKVMNFPFPTPPDKKQLAQAEKLLINLGAIDAEKSGGTITSIGEELLRFPVSPRFGKMLVQSRHSGVLEYVTALVAGLAVGEVLLPEVQSAKPVLKRDEDSDNDTGRQSREHRDAKEATRQRHEAYTRAAAQLACLDKRSDAVKLLTAVVMHAEDSLNKEDGGKAFSARFSLRERGMQEAQQLREQLWSILQRLSPPTASLGEFQSVLPPPTNAQLQAIKQATTAGFIDQVAIRADALSTEPSAFRWSTRATDVPYRTLFPTTADAEIDRDLSYSDQELQRSVFVYANSVLGKSPAAEMPRYLIYSHLSRASPPGATAAAQTTAKAPRTRLHPLTSIGPKNLAFLAQNTPLLEYGNPIDRPEEDLANRTRTCWVKVSLRAPNSASSGWPLATWRVKQKRGKAGAWDFVKVEAYGA